MLQQQTVPILEYDTAPLAKLNPSGFADEQFPTNRMIITFFPEVMNRLQQENLIEPVKTIPGENPVYLFRFTEEPEIMITLGQVGCPACGGNLDLFNAMGITKVMFCGGGGVLDRNIAVGRLLVVEGAIRDEGFSYHYMEPSRYVYTDPAVTDKITAYLEKNDIPYLRGITWTTDAMFRETPDRIDLRRQEGAKIVEMEQAGCIAVARFRGFDYGAIIYGGDDVSQQEWSNRGWQSRHGIRYNLVMLCKELVKEL